MKLNVTKLILIFLISVFTTTFIANAVYVIDLYQAGDSMFLALIFLGGLQGCAIAALVDVFSLS